MTKPSSPAPFFPAHNPRESIADRELRTLQYWKDDHVFERTVNSRHPRNAYTFFDGPPFATGLPHYGHILAGTIKDVIPRFRTMQGYRVERRFGWDCHGVPVEFQVEKEHNIGGKPGIEAMGTGPFNELCRSIVLRCRDDWQSTVERMGRFVDFKNDYKTMDPPFMESVWWVFKTMFEKGLIYQGEKVVAYSPALGSPLSNFEANLNYQDIDDPALTVRFQLADGTYVLAWTTTPWTLPSNLALGFGAKLTYALVQHEGDRYWVAQSRVESLFGEDATVLETKLGADFQGLSYTPLFDFFVDPSQKRFQCLSDTSGFVTDDSGTGVVHLAPSFGEDDARLCQLNGIRGVNPIDDAGYFDDQIPALTGTYFRFDPLVDGSKEKNANLWVIDQLKSTGQLFRREQIRHSYPHCWRTDCALMYRGIHTWFVDVQKVKSDLLTANQDTAWVPSYLKDGRFGKGLENAPDWAISRNRFWGTPLPVWTCEETGEIQVIGSIEELEQKSGETVTDLHRHHIDHLTWTGEKGGTMRRVPEVLDCWFESGSMPYASQHYPFATQDFRPADFIAEGLDQTRCWFYNLHVLGVALTGGAVYKNIITNGIVLAEDGTKMSKSKKNYPDPNDVFGKYGADAVRYYLMSSPAVRGENLRFAEHGVDQVLKQIVLPLQSAYQFLSTYATIDGWTPTRFLVMRHGQAEHNVLRVYSGLPDTPHSLTEKGIAQAQATVKTLPDFTALYASPLVRTRETAQVVKDATGFTGEIHIDDRLREVGFGDLEGQTYVDFFDRENHPTTEKHDAVRARTQAVYDELSSAHRGETVCVVAHGDSTRAFLANAFNVDNSKRMGSLPTGGAGCAFATPQPSHTLDHWILGELQTLTAHLSEKLEAYDIEGALRPLPAFIDALTNWYIRRSRRRFWASGLTDDKRAAYETLHHVLTQLSLLIAPVMPFLAEYLWQSLGGLGSVHVQYIPSPRPSWINPALQASVQAERDIVRLASSLRANANIRQRQPLASLRFALTTPLELNLDVIAEEANVKHIEVLSSLDGIATEGVKIDARQVGKQFGKKTQALIRAGKEGRYTINPDGTLSVEGETLPVGTFERFYTCAEGVQAASSSVGVVLLDTTLTPELQAEGAARDIIRHIQEARKNAGFQVDDRIHVAYQTDDTVLQNTLAVHQHLITTETLAESLTLTDTTLSEATVCDIQGATFSFTLTKHV